MHLSKRFETTMPDGRRASIILADSSGSGLVSIIDTDPWSVLRNRGLIEESEYRAACSHSETWKASGFVGEMRTNFEENSFSGRTEPADRLDGKNMEAWRRWRDAQACIPVFARGQIYAVIAFGDAPYDLRKLRVGLRALSKFYRV